MARTARIVGILVALVGSQTAYALKPATHANIATASCLAAGLGRNTCARIATEDYNTDSREWEDLRAHAQIDDDQTACVAADATAGRLYGLGADLRIALANLSATGSDERATAVDSAIGRALHTIQDNCAHHGMPNPQHAWFSLGDYCDGTKTSPDLDPAAAVCARTETDALMRDIAAAIAAANLPQRLDGYSCPPSPTNNDHGNAQQTVCQVRFLPGPFDACNFLGRAKDWDGIDRTWNNAVATPALHAAFAAGLNGEPTRTSMCGGDESRLSNAVSKPVVDVSAGAPSCPTASLFCLGKADDSANPFADDPVTTDEVGCNAGGTTSLWFVALALIGLIRYRRTA
ncbi:MAG: hypothetical protein ABI591_29025 [Kofleriaceae bacterium]